MKQVLAFALALVLVLSLAACASSTPAAETKTEPAQTTENPTETTETEAPAEETAPAEEEKPFRVCLMTALLGDKSFADSAYEGGQRAIKELGVDLTHVQLDETTDDYTQAIMSACEEGYDLIVCGNSGYQEYIETAAEAYPNQKFGITDTIAAGDNTVSAIFAQNQGSFLCGYAAARFTEMTSIDGVNEDTVIGWVGGGDIPALRDFFVGFEEGAKYYNPDITVLQSFAGVWNDPLKGKELTLAMYDQGADIVMNVASGTGVGVLEAAAEAGLYAIGVDMNQDGDQPGHILTSMLKENGTAVYEIIKAAQNGTFEGGTYMYLDLAYGGVDTTDMSTIKSTLSEENAALLDELLAEIADLKQQIASGELVVSNYEGFGPQA